MKKIKLVTAVFAMILLFSCTKTPSVNLYTPTAADVTATASLAQLQEGRTLYINNCSSCHDLYSPDSFSTSGWTSILSSMAPRTSMNSTQISLVSKYVKKGN
jgi:mono/diheme cytochrome c family protein